MPVPHVSFAIVLEIAAARSDARNAKSSDARYACHEAAEVWGANMVPVKFRRSSVFSQNLCGGATHEWFAKEACVCSADCIEEQTIAK